MSTATRASTRGGKNSKTDTTEAVKSGENASKSQKSDGKSQKNSQGNKQSQVKPSVQPTAEQLRIASLIKDNNSEDPDLKNKIKTVMDATKKSEEAVCAALAECDDDPTRAVDALLEGNGYEFISVKKKKNKAAPGTKAEAAKEKAGAEDESTHVSSNSTFERRGRGRGRGGGPNDRGGKWRNRENKENERSQDDKFSDMNSTDRPRRGGPRMTNGPGRFGGRGGRGGGRMGPRTFQNRIDRDAGFPQSIDTWNNPGAEETTNTGKMETWGEFPSPEDWDNEEYTGSLADSKVFTPSTANETVPGVTEDPVIDTLNSSFNSTEVQPEAVLQPPSDDLRPASPVGMSSTLTAAQNQFLSQLTAQAQNQGAAVSSSVYSSSVQPSYATVSSPSTSVSYTGTEFVNSYSSTLNDIANTQQVMPQRNKAPRTRVPPPSKIPASAVEMPPGDSSVSSGLGIIDVQFGALDFGSESTSFEPSTDTAVQTLPKYSSQATDPISDHSSYVMSSNTSLAAAASQLKTNHASLTSSLTKNSESLLNNDTSNYNTGRSTTLQELANMASKTISVSQDVNLHSASYDSSSFPQSSASLYQSKAPAVSTYTPPSTGYSVSSNAYSSSGYATSISNGSYNTTQYPTSTFASSYVPSVYPGYQPANTLTQSYPYGGNTMNALGTASTYNSYQMNFTTSVSSQHSHKLTTAASSLNKDSQYESIPPSAVSSVSTTSSSSAGLSSLTQTTISSTKSSTNPPVSKTNVASIPPGVAAPVVGPQYIMSQTGVPYLYNQTHMYNFEDLSLMPNRIPAHAYYDMSSFPATSLPGTRDGAGGLANVAYSMSDGRFARTDNNASPVPSSLSTQNASQTPIMNPAALPPAYYYYSSIPSNFASYSTPTALYPVPATGPATGHGTPTSAQYKSSPAYNSTGYGSTYEVLNQNPATDYSKQVNTGGYASSQQPTKTSGTSQGVGGPTQTPSSGNTDLSGNMYSTKPHASLNKVNSYDKQTFAVTPPPFNLPGVGNAVGGMGPTGAFTAQHTYPPVMLPHSANLMHQQPHLQDSSGNSTSRSQTGSQVKTGSKAAYYGSWTQN